MNDLRSFYHKKRVLITGHTGFKGTWLSQILLQLGAEVTGYGLSAPTQPSLFALTEMDRNLRSIIGDIRDLDTLEKVFCQTKPEIVFHLAAQPIVRESYRDPVGTYNTNVMGTVHLLECVRHSDTVQSVINVTTDKVYYNQEWEWGYRENEVLDGYDPYSNSKSCSELVTASYIRSFLSSRGIAVSTMRAGNVIGGGDFAADRILPDCIRDTLSGKPIIVRNPYSVRPYQHVIEPLMAYLMVAQKQCDDPHMASSYNVGPDEKDCIETGKLVDLFCDAWGQGASWQYLGEQNPPHEANFLRLDCSRMKSKFGWKPCWSAAKAVQQTVNWTQVWTGHGDLVAEMNRQIDEYQSMS